MLTLILGDTRRGKSRLAQRQVMDAGRMIYVATTEAIVNVAGQSWPMAGIGNGK